MDALVMKALVEDCYKDVLTEISDAMREDRCPHVSDIIRDWKCCAAEEWYLLTLEEVDRVFDNFWCEIEKEHEHDAMAYA